MMNDEGERGAVYKCSDLTTTHEHMCTTEGKQMFATLDWGGLVSAVNYDVKFDGEGQFGILQVSAVVGGGGEVQCDPFRLPAF